MTAPLLVRAIRGEAVERVPAWVMRQAGRYLPEYRALKEKHGFVGMLTDPALAAEVTLQPVRRFPLDAAILFSDIMTPLMGMGVGLRFDPGPILEKPIRTREQAEALTPFDAARDAGFVGETLRRVKRDLPAGVALIGFAGSPFTVASYLVQERGGKDDAAAIRRMAREDRDTLLLLLGRIATATAAYLRMQIAAGADAVQVFDTRGPLLSGPDYRDLDLPFLRTVLAAAAGVPSILYCGGAPHQWADAAGTGAAALSVDHRFPLDEVRAAVGPSVALQGNLDPAALFGSRDAVAAETERVVLAGGARRFVFNLGHGIWPGTPVDAVSAMLETVRSVGTRVCEGRAAREARGNA